MKKYSKFLTFKELCRELSISSATGKNWLKLNKIRPDKIVDNQLYFSETYLENLKKEILYGENTYLKSRRNKTFVSGSSMYNSYISADSKNLRNIQSIIDILAVSDVEPNESDINILLAECAIQLYCSREGIKTSSGSFLYEYLNDNLNLGAFEEFIKPLISDNAIEFIKEYPELFNVKYTYEEGEDIPGLLYISTKNLGKRKAAGAYYTPTKIVKQLVNNIEIPSSKTVLDPCCGTGNFLLQLPEHIKPEDIYGNDIDSASVLLTRINLALKFRKYDNELFTRQITLSDFLTNTISNFFDYIIGNPPWGFSFSDAQKKLLSKIFKSAQAKNIESFDVFIEQALNNLKLGGKLSFVLPEAVLNVKTHEPVRKVIIENNNIEYVEFLGNAFDKVQCPSIILQITRTDSNISTAGLIVKDHDLTYTIMKERNINPDCFSFKTTDEEYNLIQKLLNKDKTTTLKNQAVFALGIVTGNNNKYVASVKTDSNELLLKGSDIYKYGIRPSGNYINFTPDKFQQVAPTEYYRAKEKLLYRFICNKLVFAYDDKQTLTLNSCNILIPNINGLDIKYVMAVLNSKIAQFIYSKQFNSVKILRSHLEQIPIPIVDISEQNSIINRVNSIIDSPSEDKYNVLEDELSSIFGLSGKERKIIAKTVENSNLFLL